MNNTPIPIGLSDSLEYIVDLLSALANEKRLLILEKLLSEEMSVGNLARYAKLSQSALSQHLAKLRMCGLVSTRRDAQTIYYRVSSPSIQPIMTTLIRLQPVSELQSGSIEPA